MSNLDNIINEILEDAKKESEQILNNANQEKEKIIETKIDQANQEKDTILNKAESEAKGVYDRHLSQVVLKSRDNALFAKQEVIDSVLQKIKDKLKNMSLEDYKKYLTNSLSKMDLNDLLVLQSDKYDSLKNENFNVKISDETVDSGFCIKRGNVLINNNFSSLVDSMKDELEVEIAKTLFKK